MKIRYISKTRWSKRNRATLDQAIEILEDFAAQGYDLTVRQLFYQLVSRDLIRNTQADYRRIVDIVNDGRLCGLIDWNMIEDRTRNLKGLPHWSSPEEIMSQCAQDFMVDQWANQPNRVEVWIEKDAMVGLLSKPCNRNDVPFFSCRGYTSQSEMHVAAMRAVHYHRDLDPQTVILHLGDHDPSGIDMTRDITDRLNLFCDYHFCPPPKVVRIALNMDQIREYDPPPNPVKFKDTRAPDYVALYGRESWELDALRPDVVDRLITKHIEEYRDEDLWQESKAETARGKDKIRDAIAFIQEHNEDIDDDTE